MNKYKEVIIFALENDFIGSDSVYNLLKHKRNLSITCQQNFINIMDNTTNKFFFKLYIHNNNKWDFFDYGYLVNSYFYALASKLLIFNVPDIEFKISRHQDSLNHIIIEEKNICYLLYNPYKEVIDKLFDYINNNKLI
ncbi:hypothetical protein H012_gp235 [Acanthamoeba polyphaga moumouvirus]|uniref:Uncharacterized protein n=2 Tax=Moumouvirus TaxID=3080801 RepID=L7RCZ8_9VIRU|nr:hypothetical protein H012_gp235 [Acanthamoeba polyphaga moumouvirus]AEX62446.1 hypothetical protein mv_L241 [Moumouvirus Monve]AGC02217.1 hypothetical protein Moumou_00696 [Acanthamoeba polyphaga moumouvirus]